MNFFPKPNPKPNSNQDETTEPSAAAHAYFLKEQSFLQARTPKALMVGGYQLWAGGVMFFDEDDLDGYDLLVPLTQRMVFGSGRRYQILAMPLRDFGGVDTEFERNLKLIVEELKKGTRILIFCDGGLGRTGTVLAGLIAILESKEQTPDPIQAVRERYREIAVETYAQAQAVFKLRRENTPEHYRILQEVDTLRYTAWQKQAPV